jgi:hypothetical protein
LDVNTLKIAILLMICLLASMNSFNTAAQTAIYQVNSPSHALAGTETPLPISVTIYYHNAVTGARLVVGILDASSSPERIVPGAVVFSTDTCANQPEASAVCMIAVAKSSGIVKIDFQIGGIFDDKRQPTVWNLNVTSLLINPQNNLIPGSVSSKLLKINLTQATSNNQTNLMNNPDTLAALSQLDYPIPVAIALTIIAAAIIAILIAQRMKRSTATRYGSKSPRYSA